MTRGPACTNHTPHPPGYRAAHLWAERMAETHRQEQCPDCGLWVIWSPRQEVAD